jgi:hypothetical protein
MEDGHDRGIRRWLRWSIGSGMTFVAAAAVVLALIRPEGPSIQAQVAVQVIKGQMSGFQESQYRVVDEVKSRDGRYWQVKGDELTATVPDSRVQAARKAARR